MKRAALDAAFSAYLRALGKKGGAVRAKRMTAAERSASARKAARARWGTRSAAGA